MKSRVSVLHFLACSILKHYPGAISCYKFTMYMKNGQGSGGKDDPD